jgi:hypothetical protein
VKSIVGQDKPDLLSIRHSGIKGMKWGVRKTAPTTGDIHDARSRQNARANTAVLHPSAKTRTAASKEFHTSEDRVTAARMTRGEKMAAVLLAGPIGGAVIVGNHVQVKRIARKTDVARIRQS